MHLQIRFKFLILVIANGASRFKEAKNFVTLLLAIV